MSHWLVDWPARVAPLASLLCLPGAGAGASAFRGWAEALPPFVAVSAAQLPGREGRIEEQLAESLPAVADAIVDAWLTRRPLPTVIFGHSMGAVLGYEIARRLAKVGHPATALVLSASAPPQGAAAPVDEADLRALLLAYDPANARITGDDELYWALAPILAADIAMLRRHRFDVAPLQTPAVILTGENDHVVPASAAANWAGHFTHPVDRRNLPGGHFFVFREANSSVLDLLSRLLERSAG